MKKKTDSQGKLTRRGRHARTRMLVAVLAAGLAAGTAWGADLITVYRDALAYDAQFASAKASVEAGREKLPQGRAGLLPTIGLSGNTTWNDIDYTLRGTAGTSVKYNTNGWTATLSQPLFRWQNWLAYNQGELQVVQAEAQFGAARQDLIVRVAQAYFDVLLAQEALATTRAQKAAIGEQLEAAKRNFEVGTATITDTNEAQSRYDLAVAQEIAAESDLLVKHQALRQIVGKDHEFLKNLRANVLIGRPQPDNMDAWVETAESGNPSVLLSKAGLEIAALEAKKQRAGHYPTVDLVATRGRASQSATIVPIPGFGAIPGSDTDSTTVGVQLAIPIFSGGLVSSRDREAVSLREKAAADLDNARRSAALQARQSYLGVTSGLSQVKAYEAALISSQSSLDSNKLGYEVGVRINIDVLNAQGQLYDTRQKLAKARLDTLSAQLKLKAAAGNLTEDDLVAINALLE
ncbi:MAG: TolC family outer membrane protein [Rhodocyclaceae bacterium]|nr:TolC family outer membrane protein [Rhodocyclaceae bacterium]